MNIQIFGKSKCFDTKKAERYFKERRVKYQYIDMKKYGISRGELNGVLRSVPLSDLVDPKHPDAALLQYLAYDQDKVEKVLEKRPELDAAIDETAKGWSTRRMGKVELTILRLALFEIRFDEEVPDKVAINEAVELAKKFGGDESPAFVNGILAKLV
mgnify:CR=1 FL=1